MRPGGGGTILRL